MSDKHLLALDVGTRKVTGMLLGKKEKGFEILAVETREHRTRAMLDGQIHDIPRVAEVVSEIHNLLQEKGQCKISKAAVAAAGRSLYTQRGRAQLPVASSRRLLQEDVLRLEYAAVQQAQQQKPNFGANRGAAYGRSGGDASAKCGSGRYWCRYIRYRHYQRWDSIYL